MVLPFLIASGMWLGALGMEYAVAAYVFPPLFFAVFAGTIAANEARLTYALQDRNGWGARIKRMCRVVPYMILNTGMMPHHFCAFLEGMLGPLHAEFVRTPKTASTGGQGGAKGPAARRPRKPAIKDIAYLKFEIFFCLTLVAWAGFFIHAGQAFAAFWSLWILACVAGLRAAPALHAAFDAALALEPGDREAATLRAQALSWDNRQAEAEAAYRALLAADPADERALLGLARVQSWRGRQRAALASLSRLPANPADPVEAVTITAEAQQWLGRPDRAAATLRNRLAAAPDDTRARWLSDRLEREIAHEIRLDARRFDQSDGLDIEQFNLGADYRFADGRGRFGPRLQYAAFDPFDGPGDIYAVTRIGVSGGWRASDALDLNATVGVDSIDAPGPGDTSDFLTYDAYATLFPADRWRIDAGVQRFTFDSEPTLRNRLVVDQVKLSADFLPTERTRLTLRAAHADFSDTNRQRWWQAEIEQRVGLAPRLWVGLRYTGTTFRLVNQEGYFSPEEYHSLEATLRLDGRAGPRTVYGIRASAGAERDVGSAERFILSGSAYLRQQLSARLDLEAAYDYTSSSAASSTGFERGIARISLIARF